MTQPRQLSWSSLGPGRAADPLLSSVLGRVPLPLHGQPCQALSQCSGSRQIHWARIHQLKAAPAEPRGVQAICLFLAPGDLLST